MSDSALSSFGFSTPEMDEIYGPASFVAAMLDFERALALALADTAVAPSGQAATIAAACEAPIQDANAVLGTTWQTGTPVIALVDEIKSRIGEEERRWVHHGATTQDVIDTAQMLLARRGLEALERSMTAVATHLRELVTTHTGHTQMGRTFLQHARGTTFAHRAAAWLNMTLRHIENLRDTRSALPVQLGGPVGDLETYGTKGTDVVAALADHLEMRAPAMSWHTDRWPVWDVVWAVDRSVASIAKMATDVALLAQSDTAELLVRAGESSSMDHKRNPIDAIHALAAADVCNGAAEMILGARPHELDRAVGSWHVEWVALPLLFRSASATLAAGESLFATMEVDVEAMSGRVPPHQAPGELDSRQIERVLDVYDRVVEGT